MHIVRHINKLATMKIITLLFLICCTHLCCGQNRVHRLNLLDYNKANEYWQNSFEKISAASIKSSTKITQNRSYCDTVVTEYNRHGSYIDSRYKFDLDNRILLMDGRSVEISDTLIDTIGFICNISYTDTSIIEHWKTYSRGDTIVRYSDVTYLYNQKGLLKKGSSFSYTIGATMDTTQLYGDQSHSYEYAYDDYGRIRTMEIIRPPGIYRLYEPTYFEYLYSGDTIIKRSKRMMDKRGFPKYYNLDEISLYDSIGRLRKIEFKEYELITKKEINTYSTGYVMYDQYGNEIERKSSKGKLNFTKYKYDKFGNILQEQHYKKTLGLFTKKTYIVTYNYEYF